MLLEQALFTLPEILVGSHYPKQEYEGGLVGALSLAVLQELNGRNGLNPLSFISTEKLYSIDGFGTGGNVRYLRADLHLSLDRLRTGTQALASYGWRHSNWLEAKFFRVSAGTQPKTTNTGHLAADLLRLIALTPLEKPKQRPPAAPVQPAAPPDPTQPVQHAQLSTGRYLLHCYEGEPTTFVATSRNATRNTTAGTRRWLEQILTPGHHQIASLNLGDEGDSFLGPVNRRLNDVAVTMTVQNVVVSPIANSGAGAAKYTCVLTRIESYTIHRGADSWEVRADRTGTESSLGARKRIQDAVGQFVHLAERRTDAPPTPAEREAAEAEPDVAEGITVA